VMRGAPRPVLALGGKGQGWCEPLLFSAGGESPNWQRGEEDLPHRAPPCTGGAPLLLPTIPLGRREKAGRKIVLLAEVPSRHPSGAPRTCSTHPSLVPPEASTITLKRHCILTNHHPDQ
jgi:hypothetical protein